LHNLQSILYHDVQVSWTDAFRLTGLKIAAPGPALAGESV
jgi:hypothetical protein